MELKATIIDVKSIEGVNKNGNKYQYWEILCEHEHGQYPKRMLAKTFDEKIINTLAYCKQMNQECTISLNINAREFQSKWYNEISIWKATTAYSPNVQGEPQQAQYAQQPVTKEMVMQPKPHGPGDMPF